MFNKKRKEVLKEAASNHRESLRKNLQYRLEIARASGNQELVSQLEAEADYLRMS
ncbi:hypothetical protein PN462_00910 [Spirulina sp. CS-785/01]|uniref:arginine synthesis PII-interacting regulator PirA n=1 Tax=Spirulina sp. CS-785/01 TaxID=3021716 RepID=UPI00232EF079|nr:hypothetical protein [Spirulina sp. CS-785/01]MDB9311642.1 hypothetical protein [Spirulina sp. CS-785/01]